MKNKVMIFSIDGMRPDGLLQCGNPFVEEMMKKGTYTLEGSSVNPTITLPCHMSMFHSVNPERHGVTGNGYKPMVRPIHGLFEQVCYAEGKASMYYNWEPMRDVARPESLQHAEYIFAYSLENSDRLLTQSALNYIRTDKPDLVFVHMVETDQKGGHDYGWMSKEYLQCISNAIDNVKMAYDEIGDEYTIVVTADHGGHDRMHGTLLPEDLTIPIFFIGADF